jgi:uncharacterized protein YeaO (DUF488 family)
MIQIKRAYDPPGTDDGPRILVDRLWPRGMNKEALRLDRWQKDVAPSDSLRRWFGHDPNKWDEFCQRYFDELNSKPDTWQPLLTAARQGKVTLLFSAKDLKYNNAVALKIYLEKQLT